MSDARVSNSFSVRWWMGGAWGNLLASAWWGTAPNWVQNLLLTLPPATPLYPTNSPPPHRPQTDNGGYGTEWRKNYFWLAVYDLLLWCVGL